MASRTDWAAAYYRQAAAEWDFFREVQARPDVAPCFALHLLQMATEKLAKAYRFRDTTTAEAVPYVEEGRRRSRAWAPARGCWGFR